MSIKTVSCSYSEVDELVQNLANQIQEDDFVPEVMIAIAGGGLIPARLLRNHLKIPIFTINLKLYEGVGEMNDTVKILQGLDDMAKDFIKNKKILIVDEIHDSGKTMCEAIRLISEVASPENMAYAVLHYKCISKKGKLSNLCQKWYASKLIDNEWILYPWSPKEDFPEKDAILEQKHSSQTKNEKGCCVC
jgi:hypothetical protein